jgi:hypothetical protein
MSKIYTYSPEDVSVSVNGAVITGFSEGTFITAEREEDAFTKVVGSDGDVTRSKNPNKSGTIALTLKGSSAGNDTLTALASLDEIDGSGIAAVMVKDNSGRTVCAGKGWIQKLPTVEFAKEVTDREWMIAIGKFTMFVGGNTGS